jgi:hypothetical protein
MLNPFPLRNLDAQDWMTILHVGAETPIHFMYDFNFLTTLDLALTLFAF